MRIKEVVTSAEQRSVDIKKKAAKKAAVNLRLHKAQQKLQKLNSS